MANRLEIISDWFMQQRIPFARLVWFENMEDLSGDHRGRSHTHARRSL